MHHQYLIRCRDPNFYWKEENNNDNDDDIDSDTVETLSRETIKEKPDSYYYYYFYPRGALAPLEPPKITNYLILGGLSPP